MCDLKVAQIYELPLKATIEPYRLRLDKSYFLTFGKKKLAFLMFSNHSHAKSEPSIVVNKSIS